MNNTSINTYSYIPSPVKVIQRPTIPTGTEVKPRLMYSTNTNNFEDDYWKYQTTCAINNQITINNNKNYYTGKNIMNEFYQKYPNLNSFTMSEAIAKKFDKNNASPYLKQFWKNKADNEFKTMIEILEKRPDNKNITFEEYINMIEKEFQEYNFANCGERAYYLHNQMNKKGINNTVVEIGGKSAENSHVFNVIGLDKNADISNPETWGENAIVVDVWANKLCSPKEAINYYRNFLNYGEDNPIQFKELDINKILKRLDNTKKTKFLKEI